MKKTIFLMLLCIAITFTVTFGVTRSIYRQREVEETENSADTIRRLKSLSLLSTEEKTKTSVMVAENLVNIENALEVNLYSNDPDTVNFSIYMIGYGRFSRLSGSLVDKIKLEDHGEYRKGHEMNFGGLYPCVDALIEIGYPCVPSIIENLATNYDKASRDLCLTVLLNFSGHQDKELEQLYLKREIAQEKETGRKRNLQAAMASLSQMA